MADFAVVLTYKDVFGYSSPHEIIDLLKGISPETLLLTLGKTSASLLAGTNSLQIFNSYTSSYTNHHFRTEILKIDFRLRSNSHNVLFNEKSNFHFLKMVVENYAFLNEHTLEDDSEILEINFFRVYLLINQAIYDSNNSNFLKGIPAEHFLEFAQILMMKKTIVEQQETDFFSDFLKIKAQLHYFFLEDNELLNQFYKLHGITNPDLWIFEIFRILTLANNYNNNAFYVEDDHWIADYCDGILVNKIIGKTPVNDIELKLNSLYKKDSKYYVLNWSNFGQHLFYKITYQLYELYKKKYDSQLKFDAYKSLISDKVSEKIVFRKAVERSFGRKGTFISYGCESFLGFPDCYLRYNNFVCIFEFKDNELSREFLSNESYQFAKTFIDDRFILNTANGKEKRKGISQLVKVIESLNENIQKVDPILLSKYKKTSVEIVPILVVSESMFSQPAVESYLTKEFTKIKPSNTDFRNINDLVMVNVSTLIHYFLNAEKPDFLPILKIYLDKKKRLTAKGMVPDFPSIDNIPYRKIEKAKQLVEMARELPICDIDLDEQLRKVRETRNK
ncbi:hypothetical protein [Chryseobacterium koreense]